MSNHNPPTTRIRVQLTHAITDILEIKVILKLLFKTTFFKNKKFVKI